MLPYLSEKGETLRESLCQNECPALFLQENPVDPAILVLSTTVAPRFLTGCPPNVHSTAKVDPFPPATRADAVTAY